MGVKKEISILLNTTWYLRFCLLYDISLYSYDDSRPDCTVRRLARISHEECGLVKNKLQKKEQR
jgi:hypothetical protein